MTIVERGGHPYIVRQSTDNGKKGNIVEAEEWLNPGNTISFGQDTATMFYQEEPYFTGDKIKILQPKYQQFGKANAQFFLACMRKTFQTFAWGSSRFNIETLSIQNVRLPIKEDGSIDFAFMETFIAELEAERLAELEAYLQVTGLTDYELTPAEQKALEDYDRLEWKDFDVLDIFDVKNTHNILARDIVETNGATPYLCAGAENNSVDSYIDYDPAFLEKGHCIFIGGKTFTVTYQEKDFFSNDSHNLALYTKNIFAGKAKQFCLATCLKCSLSNQYSWGNSISKAKIKNDKISLPVKDGKPYYGWMDTLVSAVQKLVIKNVVLYADRKIQATNQIITKRTPKQYPTVSVPADPAADTPENR